MIEHKLPASLRPIKDTAEWKSREIIDSATVYALVAMKSGKELPMQSSCHEVTVLLCWGGGGSAHARDPSWRQKNRIDFSSSLFASNDVSFLLVGYFLHKREQNDVKSGTD